jgi:AraC-like DNA-binding protein
MPGYPLIELSPEETLPHLPHFCHAPFITLAHLFNAPSGWYTQTRIFQQYVIQYVVNGVAEYEIEGKIYTTKKGDLVIHHPLERNEIRTIAGEPYICISIVFHLGGADFPLRRLMDAQHYCGNYINHPVEHMLSQLISLFIQNDLESHLKCQGLLMQIFSEVAKWLRDKDQPQRLLKNNRRTMTLLKNHIIECYNSELCFATLEQLSGLSKNYMISQFTKHFGISPMQYQLSVRVKKAKELAIQTNLSISEIAQMVGYSDVHTFGKMFKKKTGTSLSAFCSSLTL